MLYLVKYDISEWEGMVRSLINVFCWQGVEVKKDPKICWRHTWTAPNRQWVSEFVDIVSYIRTSKVLLNEVNSTNSSEDKQWQNHLTQSSQLVCVRHCLLGNWLEITLALLSTYETMSGLTETISASLGVILHELYLTTLVRSYVNYI